LQTRLVLSELRRDPHWLDPLGAATALDYRKPGRRELAHHRPAFSLNNESWTTCEFLEHIAIDQEGTNVDAITLANPDARLNRPQTFDVLCDYLVGMWRAFDASGGETSVNPQPYAADGGARLLHKGWPSPSVTPPSVSVILNMIFHGFFPPPPFAGIGWLPQYTEEAEWARVHGTDFWVAVSEDVVAGHEIGFRSYQERDTIGLAVRILRESFGSLRGWEAAPLQDPNSGWTGSFDILSNNSGSVIDLIDAALRRDTTVPFHIIGVTGDWAIPGSWAATTIPGAFMLIDRSSDFFEAALTPILALRERAQAQWVIEQDRRQGTNVANMAVPVSRRILRNAATGLMDLAGTLLHEYAHDVWGRTGVNTGGDTACCGPRIRGTDGTSVILRNYDFSNGNWPSSPSEITGQRQRHGAIRVLQGWTHDLLQQSYGATSDLRNACWEKMGHPPYTASICGP